MRRTENHIDHVLLLIVVALMGLGLIMVYSASSVTSLAIRSDGLFYFRRQLAWVVIGILCVGGFSKLPYKKLKHIAAPAMGLAIFFLILVLVPGVARDIGGARRWLRIGGLGFQPSEFTKICFIIYMAYSISERQQKIKSFFYGLLPDLTLTCIIFYLIHKEPNLSSATLIAGTYFIMYFLGNGSLKNLSVVLVGGFATVFALIFHAGYRLRRLYAFLDPWESAQTSGYHIIQSLVAIGSGGLWGLGLGESRQKFFILPERHTDFIFAIICEELGLIGGLFVLGLFFVLIWRGLYIACRAPDMFSFLLASGITSIIGLQVIVNVAVVLSLMPTTGITLPFISYGGSSLVFLAIGVGILLNISKYGNKTSLYEDSSSKPFSGLLEYPNQKKVTRRG